MRGWRRGKSNTTKGTTGRAKNWCERRSQCDAGRGEWTHASKTKVRPPVELGQRKGQETERQRPRDEQVRRRGESALLLVEPRLLLETALLALLGVTRIEKVLHVRPRALRRELVAGQLGDPPACALERARFGLGPIAIAPAHHVLLVLLPPVRVWVAVARRGRRVRVRVARRARRRAAIGLGGRRGEVFKVVVDHEVRDRFVRHVRVVIVSVARIRLARGRLAAPAGSYAAEACACAGRLPRGRLLEVLQRVTAGGVGGRRVVGHGAFAVVGVGVVETRIEGRFGRGGWMGRRRQVRDDVGPY